MPSASALLRAATSDTPPRLRATGLACARGTRVLFRGLDFELGPGQLLWLRGRNGAGKTSLLKLAAGLAEPHEGRIDIDGVPARRAERQDRLVFVAHANALKDDLAAGEALAFLLRIHGRPFDGATLDAALDRLGILSRRDAPVRTLSQGQRRRVALARLAVEQRPTLWLLDEPFDALDTDGLSRVNAVLAGHLYRGGSIMLTSHLDLDTAVLHPIELDLDRASSLAKP